MNSIFQRRLGAPAASALGLTLALAATTSTAQVAPAPAPASQAELAQRLDRLSAELADVKAQLARLQAQQSPQAPQPAATAGGGWGQPAGAAPAAPAPAALAAAPLPAPAAEAPATVLTSYGEINYNRPTRASDKTQLDLRRFVLGLQHRVSERTKIVGEIEVEHAVTSSSDPGEVAIEQAYVEHQLTPLLAARGGLFLMPVGLLNENHEPTAYYGVERNFVETAIIPTTWREAGAQLIANFDNGLTLQGGVSTSFDLTKWDATSVEGVESPLGSIHQEGAKAKARSLALFGAANWRGVPGLLVGASLFSGGATHGQQGFASARVTLADVHARWTPGRWDLAALYARGNISNTAQLNQQLVGNPTLIPKSFDGWYVQGAYRLWQQGDYSLSPFVRLERFNTARGFAYLAPGLTPAAGQTEQVATVGANFWVTRSVVLKADYQRFHVNTLADRVNLGLGWSF